MHDATVFLMTEKLKSASGEDLNEIVGSLEIALKENHAQSILLLSDIYKQAKYGMQDYSKCAQLAVKSYEIEPTAFAAKRAGFCFAMKNSEADLKAYFKWTKIAAMLFDSIACKSIGSAYIAGKGTFISNARGQYWTKLSRTFTQDEFTAFVLQKDKPEPKEPQITTDRNGSSVKFLD